jgi:hypothetical protein
MIPKSGKNRSQQSEERQQKEVKIPAKTRRCDEGCGCQQKETIKRGS